MKITSSLNKFFKIKKSERQYIYIPENIVTAYFIKECNEPFIKLKDYFNIKKASIICNSTILLRQKAAELLVKAAKILPLGYEFKISEGFRTLKVQKKLFDQILNTMNKKYPKKTKRELWEETTKYIADPELCPPHTTGGAIDITIVDKKRKNLDMGTRLNSIDETSGTFYPKLKVQQKKNRQLLFDTLTQVGFVNLPTEWWHYSYGDQYWAIFHQKPYAIYGTL